MLGCILFSCLWSDVMGCDPAVKEYLNIDVRCLQQSVQSSRVGKPFQKAIVSFKLNKFEV